jgi:hypothetical protein
MLSWLRSFNLYWEISNRSDPTVVPIADRHYNRQSIGSPQFVPPGRCLVLKKKSETSNIIDAFWVTSYPFAEYTHHAWAGAMVCSAFRNESKILSSQLIRDAVAITRFKWPSIPKKGMITFVNPEKVKHRRDPGRCFLKAGFNLVGSTKGGLLAFQLLAPNWPDPAPPLNFLYIN